MTKAGWFDRFSNWASRVSGRPAAFMMACLLIVVWAALGPLVGFSDFWQLTVNTGTTIITFLMVFIIQNGQNRHSAAVQIKLDELIRVTKHAHNALLDLEELSEEDLTIFHKRYRELAEKSRRRGPPELPDIKDLHNSD